MLHLGEFRVFITNYNLFLLQHERYNNSSIKHSKHNSM